MKYLINGFEPQAPFAFFEEISAIPRPSLGEERIADYLVRFAADRGLWCYRDVAHNVLIKKPASKGREAEPTVLLQAHTDMVTEKHPHIKHDFHTEGITPQVSGNLLFANGTTLGGDDGFGVAVMLAVLDDKTLSHAPLECLFTSAEEIGLVGAGRFDYSHIGAKYMLNLDSSEEDTVIVGCCGGLRSKLTVPVTFTPLDAPGISIVIGGLCGGHSGEDIHRERLNANALMGKLLSALQKVTPFRLASITGGEKINAIPRDCEAVVIPQDMAAAQRVLADVQALAGSFVCAEEDRDLTVTVSAVQVTRALDYADTDKIMQVLAIPNGILHMRREPPIMPEASRNLANLRTHENTITSELFSRSAKEQRLLESQAEQDALAARIGGEMTYYGVYPGWESGTDAPLVRAWQTAFHTVTGKHTAPTLIHAGLETGLITNAVKGLEAIAVGCNIHNLHTPVETIELDSFARIYRTVLEFLRILK